MDAGRRLHHGRLCGRPGLVLRGQGDADGGEMARSAGLAETARSPAQRRAGAERGRTLVQIFPGRVTAFSQRVAGLTGVEESRLRRLAGGDLSEVLLVPRDDATALVAKSGPSLATEAAMLRALAAAGVPAAAVEAEHDNVLLIAHVENDGRFSPHAWADIGAALRRLHGRVAGSYGWPVDYALGTVALDNREGKDWPLFWAEQRLIAATSLLDRPWRDRVDRLAARLPDLLPADPPA